MSQEDLSGTAVVSKNTLSAVVDSHAVHGSAEYGQRLLGSGSNNATVTVHGKYLTDSIA